jgi:trimethylamine--corrinoid protein Co-methyltransferase
MSRRNKRKKSKKNSIVQIPWQEVVTKFSALEIISQDEIESIHHASLDVLESVGMKVLHQEARKIFKNAGLNVDESSQMVYFDRDLVLNKITEPPKEFTLRARNPKRDLTLGRNHIVFSAVGGPAYCSDLDKGRRRGSFEDLQNYMKLIQSLNIIHQEGGMSFEIIELPPETRYLDLYLAQFQLLDKNCQSYPLGTERTKDCIDMHCIALECTKEELAKKPSVMGIINTNSPMQLDIPTFKSVKIKRGNNISSIFHCAFR